MPQSSSTARAWAARGVTFAAATMLTLEIWLTIRIAAIAGDEFFVAAVPGRRPDGPPPCSTGSE